VNLTDETETATCDLTADMVAFGIVELNRDRAFEADWEVAVRIWKAMERERQRGKA
jgi:hypothetical protein